MTNLNNTLRDVDGAVVLVADPGDTVATESAHTHTKDTAEDGVGGRDRETKLGSHGEVAGGSDNGADHAEHEKLGSVVEGLGIDNLGADGISDTATDADGADELHHDSATHGLEVGDGARRDGAGPRVGDIVGTDVPGVEEGKDGADGEEVVELRETHDGGFSDW